VITTPAAVIVHVAVNCNFKLITRAVSQKLT